jgi:hypothetical protein
MRTQLETFVEGRYTPFDCSWQRPGDHGCPFRSLPLCLTGLFRIWWFDSITEASELPDHFPSAHLLRLFVDGGASLFVTDSLMQNQPDQTTLSRWAMTPMD